MFEWNNRQEISDDKIIKEIDNFFINSKYSGLEYRESQHKMALDIAHSILDGKHRVVEAGVGIGKTIAYLVSTLIISKYKNKTILFSTSSISLEEQLEKDIKKIIKQLNIMDLNLVVIKGQRNYLCELKLSKNNNLSVNEKNKIRKLNEIKGTLDEEYSAENCINKTRLNCKFKSKCLYYKMYQKRTTNANILICNHNYLISVLSKRTNIKDIDYIVCDEAHKLSDVIIENYTRQLKMSEKVEKLIDFFQHYEIKGIVAVNKNINTIYNRLISLMETEVKKTIRKSIIKSKNYDKLAFNYKTSEIQKTSVILCNCLNELIRKKVYVASDDLNKLIQQLNEELFVFKSLSILESEEYLFYANVNGKDIKIYYIPQDTYNLSKNMLENNKEKLFVFTSATLTTSNNDYNHFLKNMGLIDLKNVETSNSYISPYNYKDNMIIYIDETIANPKNKRIYKLNIVEKIIKLVNITQGKTLILFTSKCDLEFVYSNIKNKIKNIKILKQSNSSSQEKVISEFKENINSVLLATNYWEGIDVQGISLSQVIIARLPFPTVDAITQNKAKIHGEEIYVNDMIIKAKQGIGRLIRSSLDSGIISILDSRSAKKYKNDLKKCVYGSKITMSINDVEKFVEEKRLKN